MPTATNMQQLKEMLQSELKNAMQEVNKESLKIMKRETGNFYKSSVPPAKYRRTYALSRTPRTTTVSSLGNLAGFEAYLDQNHTYSTGRDLRAMSALLPAAEAHTYGIKGNGGFWRRSESAIGQKLKETMKSHFG
ncbi:hypothetical protein [Butyricicoccus porcorum]|uniref:HK97 gp10 family phage protein n=1 Tax=Butyricicoccus porcorum TaxID=1945634 RepID=A0A252F1P7_9FIRM|nr:hypothetical protein [Butyricicoccus porcorum]OUM19659.1 hypothetical protein CBW42_12080 [Butyricicoccus porcorum]